MINDTLNFITKELNDNEILWGVGASILLNHYGLVDKPNDIDLLIAEKDVKKADRILKSLGEIKIKHEITTYSTKYFYEYVVNGVEVDVMAGLIINHNEGKYIMEFDEKSITEIKRVNGVNVPLTSLEDWFVLYQLIPNRDNKVKLIEDYLITNGIKYMHLLKRALAKDLPKRVKQRIHKLIEKSEKSGDS